MYNIFEVRVVKQSTANVGCTEAALMLVFFSLDAITPSGPWPSPHSRGFLWFLDHTQRHTTVGRTPLDE